MLKRFAGFLIAGLLLLAFGYFFYLNPGSVDLRLSAERSYTLPLPLLLLLAFLGGALVIFLLALFRETQWTISAWRLRRRERKLEEQRTAITTGRHLHWEGLPEEARRLVRRAARAPQTLEGALVLAEAAIESDRLDEAERVLEDSIVRHPASPFPHALLAGVHRRLGRPGLAAAALEKAVAIEPNSPRLLAELREVYVEEGRWSDALRAEETLLTLLRLPEKILREQPRIRGLRYQAAMVVDGDVRVVEELRVVLAQYPGFLPAAVSLGDRLLKLGRPADAAKVWMQAASWRPAPVLLSRLESVLVELGRAKRMHAFYRRMRRRFDALALLLQNARFLLSQEDVEGAARILESGAAGLESSPGAHGLWAEVHRARGDLRLSLESLRRMLELNPAPRYACRECGRTEAEWSSRCAGCGAWDALDFVDGDRALQPR